ncbi:hypothetical protein D3C75_1089450 [compost metagenome]
MVVMRVRERCVTGRIRICGWISLAVKIFVPLGHVGYLHYSINDNSLFMAELN